MSWVGLQDTAAGIQVSVNDTPDVDGEFVAHPGPLLGRSSPHRIRFRIKVNQGLDNDVVRIAVDGRDLWCASRRGRTTTAPLRSRHRRRTAIRPRPSTACSSAPACRGPLPSPGGGYLFDNVSITPSNGPGPKPCPGGGEGPPPVDIDKTAQTQFARPGDLVTYRITVRNRGDAPVRGLRACDRTPRALRFVGARPRLRRAAGGRLCRTIRLLRPGQRKTFRATFRVRANVTADTVTNGGSVDIPTGSAPSASPPDSAAVIPKPRRRVLGRASATIGIRRAGACGAAVNPRAHAAC